MKTIFSILLMLLCVLCALAQPEQTDTVVAKELGEVVISAPKIIRKSDMDVIYPSKSVVENSKNGMQLLNNLMIPTLVVNDAPGSVQAADCL